MSLGLGESQEARLFTSHGTSVRAGVPQRLCVVPVPVSCLLTDYRFCILSPARTSVRAALRFAAIPRTTATRRACSPARLQHSITRSIPSPVSSQIRGVTKKGKEFFRFDTNLTEEIRLVRVKDVNIFTAGEFSFCRFVESKDVGFMMAPDRINDILVAPVTSTSSPGAPNCVLGCKDRKLRVLEGSNTHYEAPAGGSVSCTAELRSGAASAAEPGAPRLPGEPLELVFGTENGMVGQAFLWEDKARVATIETKKKIPPQQSVLPHR